MNIARCMFLGTQAEFGASQRRVTQPFFYVDRSENERDETHVATVTVGNESVELLQRAEWTAEQTLQTVEAMQGAARAEGVYCRELAVLLRMPNRQPARQMFCVKEFEVFDIELKRIQMRAAIENEKNIAESEAQNGQPDKS